MQELDSFGPDDVNVQSATEFQDESSRALSVYSTHSKNRGIALIMNNITYYQGLRSRNGAKIDGQTLREVFLQMGLEVHGFMNLTAGGMKAIITNLKNSSRLIDADMLFVVIMGHGSEDTDSAAILGTNNVSLSTGWIENQLRDANCEAMKNKPKIIMYQTCCGKIRTHEMGRYVGKGIRNMLIVHSTMKVQPVLCNTNVGTMYINLLCQTMMKCATTHHIQDLLQITHDKIRRIYNMDLAMHTAIFNNVGFKNCYLHPKIYLEDGQIKNLPRLV